MIELYYWPTPNGHKITLFLEETALPYTIKPVNIGKGEQFHTGFLSISPNNRIPAIIDTQPAFATTPVSVFESGAILLYLAEKTGLYLSGDPEIRIDTLQWLFWQVGGLGPMLGQNHHFNRYANEAIPYAIKRYVNETRRLYGVLDRHLAERTFIASADYSIADMACYPWLVPHEAQGMRLENFPNLHRWFTAIAARPATQRAYAQGEPYQKLSDLGSEQARRFLFGQSAA